MWYIRFSIFFVHSSYLLTFLLYFNILLIFEHWRVSMHAELYYSLTFFILNGIWVMFVCLGLTSLLNIWGHIMTVPACISGTLTNVLPHRNTMPQTQDMTPHPVTVYRHGADLSLCYTLMWNVTLEYTATQFNVLGETRPGNPSPTFHTHQRTLNLMLLWWLTVGSSVESTVLIGSWTRDLLCANPLRYPLAHSDFANLSNTVKIITNLTILQTFWEVLMICYYFL